MISMSVIHSIRCMRKEGASVAAIARELGISEPTVRKYLREVDLSARPPNSSCNLFCFNVFSAGSSVFFRSVGGWFSPVSSSCSQ